MYINPTLAFVTAVAQTEPDGGSLLEKLYLEHYKRLFNISRKLLESSEDAEDAVANAYMKVFAHIEDFEELSDTETKKLLTTYVINASIDLERNRSAKKNNTVPLCGIYSDSDRAEDIPDASVDLDEIIINKERIETLTACIDRLPDTDRQIIKLRFGYRCSTKKISRIMGMSVSAINNRISRAKVKLCSMLEENYGKQI